MKVPSAGGYLYLVLFFSISNFDLHLFINCLLLRPEPLKITLFFLLKILFLSSLVTQGLLMGGKKHLGVYTKEQVWQDCVYLLSAVKGQGCEDIPVIGLKVSL